MRLLCFLVFLLASCAQKKPTSKPVLHFKKDQYIGKWHEIARSQNRFEKDCEAATAEYLSRSDGGIDVLNSCIKNGKVIKEVKGKAYFKKSEDVGELSVSFFPLIHGTYRIVYIDKSYHIAIVDGGSLKYVWILSRDKTIPKKELNMLINKIKSYGFDESKIIVNNSF